MRCKISKFVGHKFNNINNNTQANPMSYKNINLLEKLIVEPFNIKNLNAPQPPAINCQTASKTNKIKNRSIIIKSAPKVRQFQQEKITMALSKKFPVDFFFERKERKFEKVKKQSVQTYEVSKNKSANQQVQKPQNKLNPLNLKRIKLDSKTLAKLIQRQIKPIQSILEDTHEYQTPTFKSKAQRPEIEQQNHNRSVFTKEPEVSPTLFNKLLPRPRCFSSKDIPERRRTPNDTFRIRRLL